MAGVDASREPPIGELAGQVGVVSIAELSDSFRKCTGILEEIAGRAERNFSSSFGVPLDLRSADHLTKLLEVLDVDAEVKKTYPGGVAPPAEDFSDWVTRSLAGLGIQKNEDGSLTKDDSVRPQADESSANRPTPLISRLDIPHMLVRRALLREGRVFAELPGDLLECAVNAAWGVIDKFALNGVENNRLRMGSLLTIRNGEHADRFMEQLPGFFSEVSQVREAARISTQETKDRSFENVYELCLVQQHWLESGDNSIDDLLLGYERGHRNRSS